MKQNKYGVYLTQDNVDVNDWMTRSTSLGKIGNSALSCYNYKSGIPSLLYIPKNENYGTNSYPEPLFMNITNGNYEYSTKMGFIHAVFGSDALGTDGRNERYAAEFVGSKLFTATLNKDEAHRIPSVKYGLGENGYLEIHVDGAMLNSSRSENINDAVQVIDGLMSGKNTVVIGNDARAVSAMVTALEKLPLEGANTISFNTAATTEDAARLSRLSCGSYLKHDAINSLKNDGCVIVDLDEYRNDSLISSTARIVLRDGDCNSFLHDCPQTAVDCAEYLFAVESAAKRSELYEMSKEYADIKNYNDITIEWVNLYLRLYNACKNDLGRSVYSNIREEAENCLKNLASHTIFSAKFLEHIEITALVGFLEEVPELESAIAAEIAGSVSPKRIVQLLNLCFRRAEEANDNGRNAEMWICELFKSGQENAKTAVKSFADGIKDKSVLIRVVKLLNNNSDLFKGNYPSKEIIQSKVFESFKDEGELRTVFNAVHNNLAGNSLWLLQRAFVTIENIDDLNVWKQTADGLIGDSLIALSKQFKSAFARFLVKNPVNEQNYFVYDLAISKFGYENDGLRSEIKRIEKRTKNKETFNALLEENLQSRRDFIERERLFLKGKVENDSEVEKVVYSQTYRKDRSFKGGFLLWLLAAFLIGVATAGIAVAVTCILNLPWTEFFSTLKNPIKGVPIKALLICVPFVLSIAVSLLSYIFGKTHEGRGLVRCLLCTMFIVILPYLAFVLVCAAIYSF